MPRGIEARLTTVERAFKAPPGSRLEFSHAQLVLEAAELWTPGGGGSGGARA